METRHKIKSFVAFLLNFIQALFTSLTKNDNSHLVTLISVASDNPAIRDQLLSILHQTPFQRQSLINTWLTDLELAGAPAELRNALSSLLDKDIADQALVLLTETRSDDL